MKLLGRGRNLFQDGTQWYKGAEPMAKLAVSLMIPDVEKYMGALKHWGTRSGKGVLDLPGDQVAGPDPPGRTSKSRTMLQYSAKVPGPDVCCVGVPCWRYPEVNESKTLLLQCEQEQQSGTNNAVEQNQNRFECSS